MGGVDQSAGRARGVGTDPDDAEAGQRRERETLAGTDQHHRQPQPAHVRRRRSTWASHAREREDDTGHESRALADAAGDAGQDSRDGEVDCCHRQEAESGLEGGEPQDVLHQLGGEEEADVSVPDLTVTAAMTYEKALTERATIRPKSASAMVDCTSIKYFARCVSGITSVGLNAVALVKPRCR